MGIMASQKAHDGEEGRRIETLRVSVVRERSPLSYALAAPIDAARTARELVGDDLDREVFGILLVNTRNRITAMHIVSVGTLNGAYVHPREVFKAAILGNAAAIILFHNHPSGDPDPSREDRELTRRLTDAGRILGIEVLDHVILGDEARYYSFKEHGVL
jgi:DNA repair protein RadC